MPEDPITFPSQPPVKKGPQPIEVTGFGWGEAAPAEASEKAETEEAPDTSAKE
jgi:hypothetical protein